MNWGPWKLPQKNLLALQGTIVELFGKCSAKNKIVEPGNGPKREIGGVRLKGTRMVKL